MLVRVSHDKFSEGESRFIGESIGLLVSDVFDVVLCMDVNNCFIRILKDNETVTSYLTDEKEVDLATIVRKYAHDVVDSGYIEDFTGRLNIYRIMKNSRSGSYKEMFVYGKKDGEFWRLTLHYQVDKSSGLPFLYACFQDVTKLVYEQQQNAANKNIFNLFSSEYYTVFMVDLNNDEFHLIKSLEKDEPFFSCYKKFSELHAAYTKAYVNAEYRDMVKFVYDKDNLITEFDSGRGRIDLVYNSIYGWINDNIRRMPDYNKDNRMVLYATRSYEKERAQEENEEYIRQERNNLQRIYDLLGTTYFSIQLVNTEDKMIQVIKNPEDSPYSGIVEIPDYRELYEYVEYNVYEEDKEYVKELYSYENLSSMFNNMMDIRQVEYRRYIDGELKWVSVRIQPIRLIDGVAKEVIIAARNIDEQRLEFIKKEKENMDLLSEKKDMLEFMDAISDTYLAVWVVNYSTKDLRVISCAHEYIRALVENQSSDIFGSKFKRYIEEYVEAEYREDMVKLVDSDFVHERLGYNKMWEKTYRNKKGDWITISMCKTRSYTNDNREVLCIFGNANEREMSRQMLEKALCDAENANRAKTSFFANMSHDIRTPMNAILGMADIAKENIDDREKLISCIEHIDISGKHLLQLINNVLDMTSIESGKLKLNSVDMNMDSFVDSIKAIVIPIAEKEGIDISFDTKDVIHKDVMGDVLRLRQIIINLVTNALKYTDRGGKVSLKIKEKYSKSLKKGRFTFIISDNGIGMSKEFLAKIYDPYERDNADSMTRPEGTGLGMSITKTFVGLMKGKIHIESEVGVGTKIKVDIPLEIVTVDPASETKNSFDEKEIELSGVKVLVVEDHDVNMLIMRNYLENEGMIMTGVRNGKEAVDVMSEAKEGDFDLILMDIQMPVMNGYEAARRIRNMDSDYTKNIPIFALTANAFDEDVRRAMESGMNGHLTKPIQVDILYKVIKQIIAGRFNMKL